MEAIEAAKKVFEENFFIVVNGRTPDEQGIILIEEGFCKGFGYISKEDAKYGVEELKEAKEKILVYEKLIEVTNRELGIDVRKNTATKLSENWHPKQRQ